MNSGLSYIYIFLILFLLPVVSKSQADSLEYYLNNNDIENASRILEFIDIQSPSADMKTLRLSAEAYFLNFNFRKAAYALEKLIPMLREEQKYDEIYSESLDNLAYISTECGNYKRSEELLKELIKKDIKKYGSSHAYVGKSLTGLGDIYLRTGRLSEAGSVLIMAEEIFSTNYTSKSDISRMYYLLGKVEMEKRKYSSAEGYLLRALQQENGSDGLRNYAHIYMELSKLHLRNSNTYEAERILQDAAELIVENYGENDKDYIEIIVLLSEIEKEKGNFTEARNKLKEASSISDYLYGKSHINISEMLIRKSDCYESSDSTINLLNDAMELIEKKLTFAASYLPLVCRIKNYKAIDNLISQILSIFKRKGIRNKILTERMIKLIYLNNKHNLYAETNNKSKLNQTQLTEWQGLNEHIHLIESLNNPGIKLIAEKSKDMARLQELEKGLFEYIDKPELVVLPDSLNLICIRRFVYYDNELPVDINYMAYIKDTNGNSKIAFVDNGIHMEKGFYEKYLETMKPETKFKENKLAGLHNVYFRVIAREISGLKGKILIDSDGVYSKINLNVLVNEATKKFVADEYDFQYIYLFKPQKSGMTESGKNIDIFNAPCFDISMSVPSGSIKSLFSEPQVKSYIKEFPTTSEDNMSERGFKINKFEGPLAYKFTLKKMKSPVILYFSADLKLPVTESVETKESGLFERGMFLLANYSDPLLKKNKPNESVLKFSELKDIDILNTKIVILDTRQYRNHIQDLKLNTPEIFLNLGCQSVLYKASTTETEPELYLRSSFYSELIKNENIYDALKNAAGYTREKFPDPSAWGAFILFE